MTNQKNFSFAVFYYNKPPTENSRFFDRGMDHSGDGDFFYFLFCEMIECRDDSSCADHGYNSADSDSYRAAGSDEADRKGNDDGGEIKKIFSEAHVLSAALAR